MQLCCGFGGKAGQVVMLGMLCFGSGSWTLGEIKSAPCETWSH